jgi:hypothetical protein
MDDREEQIRNRAHQIWEREGRPDGRESEHWARAMREIDDEAGSGQQTAEDADLAAGLQQGGTTPAGGPAASVGSAGGGPAGRAGGSARRKSDRP